MPQEKKEKIPAPTFVILHTFRIGNVGVTMYLAPEDNLMATRIENARLGENLNQLWTLEELCALQSAIDEARDYALAVQSVDHTKDPK